MTSPADPLSVPVQWALHGQNPDGEGYRILSCSTGDLSRANFTDVIGRFTIGALDVMPQVSLSYAQLAVSPPTSGYVTLGIHWFAGDGQRYPNQAAPFDTPGRRTQFTSYFCAPYRHLAEKSTTYQDMYEAFSAVTLPVTDGPPKALTIAVSPQRIPANDELAMRTAALLLTGTPVCVLGAEETSLQERLRFIDTVMGMLPYGFRARMTAATWARATLRNHRFRLFFSGAPRSGDQLDHMVRWGRPDEVAIPAGHAGDYLIWLKDNIGPLLRLATLSTEVRFDKTASVKALELADHLGLRRHSRLTLPHLSLPARPPGGAVTPPQVAVAGDEISEALQECARYVRDRNLTRLRSIDAWLVREAEADSELQKRAEADDALREQAEAVDIRRKRYREQIKDLGLLQSHGLGNREKDLYAALLAVAFGRPLTYAGLCQVEDCLDELPHPALLQAIKDGEMTFETKAIVLFLTRKERNEKELNKWYASGELDPVILIHWLARDWDRPRHARIICDLTLDYLRSAPTSYDRNELRSALRQHGFLTHALHTRHPDKEQYQISVLYKLIRAAYMNVPTTEAIGEILTGTSHPPTPALLAAVLLNLSDPRDIQHAQEAYLHGSLSLMSMHPQTHSRLRSLVPAFDQDPTETILLQCVSQVLAKDTANLQDSVTALRVYGPHATNRSRYLQIITDHQLISADLGLGSLTDEFYDMVLKLGFSAPLDYRGYCQLADCLTPAGQPESRPQDALLLAIDRAACAEIKGGRPDLRVTAIVAAYLESAQRDAKLRPRHLDATRFLDAKFHSGQLDAVRLIDALADSWERPHHAKLVLDALASHLIATRSRTAGYDRPAVLNSLKAHGHLAPALQSRYPDSEPDQIAALTQLLDAVYPGKLDEPTAWTILTPEARTDALLTVVSGKTDDPKVKAVITMLIRDRARRQPGHSRQTPEQADSG